MTIDEIIECIKEVKEDYWEDDGYGYETSDCQRITTALDEAIERLEQTMWIPVSERLPEKTGWYLITVKGYKGDDRVCELCYRKLENYWTGSDITRKLLDNNEVTAWMPKPEPYKASPTGG